MSYQYVGGHSPIIPPQSITPIPRAVTPTIPGMPTAGGQGQIQPGSLTYTSSVGPDGQVTYHMFKAMPASYQTPQGVVNGIQWIPADALSVLPVGATPASADIIASFSRPGDERYRDWQRDEERRRRDDKELRREDKERRRRREREEEREIEREIRREKERREDHRKSSGYAYERDLDRSFRDLDVRDRDRGAERDYDREKVRSRRGSTYGDPYPAAPAGYPAAPPGGYPASVAAGYGTSSPYGTAAQPYPAGTQQYPAGTQQYPAGQQYPGRPASPYQAAPIAPRPVSPYAQPGGIARAASPYQQPGVIPRAPSPYAGPPRAASPYQQPGASPYQSTVVPPRAASPYQPPRSPYQGGAGLPPQPPATYGLPLGYPANQTPGYGAQPGQYTPGGYPQQQPVPGTEAQPMPAPEGFSRPPNLAQPYTRFDPLKIQDMDDFFENIPRMPLVLVPHDVYHEDWIRLMTDLSLAWSGKLPVPDYARDGRPPKRQTLTSDLIDLWNGSFFLKRGVEVVLYKGRERRSGRAIGQVDVHLPGFDEHSGGLSDDSESDSTDSDDDDDYDDRQRYSAYGGVYGRGAEGQMADLLEAKRIRRERKKADKRRRKQEKKQKRKLKEAERKYALYITCVPPEP